MNQNISSAHASAPSATSTHEMEKTAVQKEVFYSAATEAMIAARKQIALASFKACYSRLERQRAIRDDDAMQAEEDSALRELMLNAKEMTLNSTQFGDDRPLTSIRYLSQTNIAASGSLAGTVKVWDTNSLTCLASLKKHSDRVTTVAWRPNHSKTLLASSSADGSCNLWDVSKSISSSSSSASMEEGSGGGYYGEQEMVVEDTQALPSESNTILLHRLKGHNGIVTSWL